MINIPSKPKLGRWVGGEGTAKTRPPLVATVLMYSHRNVEHWRDFVEHGSPMAESKARDWVLRLVETHTMYRLLRTRLN